MSVVASANESGIAVRLVQEGPIPLVASLACRPGEMLALVGPSGSGKSTILRAIAGHYRVQSAHVTVDGISWDDTERQVTVHPHKRSVGWVCQSYALFPHMTALGNVEAALGHLLRSDRKSRAHALLEMVHLVGLEHRRPAELSGGQQQRVAVARALAREPQVLLLDEPFSAVDKTTRQKLYRELAEMRRRLSIPILFVTHDLDEALMLADRMVLLAHGRTLQSGVPAEVMNHPDSAEIAHLLGLNNVFEAVVAEHRPDAGVTFLKWADTMLEARLAPGYAVGTKVDWVIPPARVVIHRRGRPSRGEHENPVSGVLAQCVALGDTTHATMHVNGESGTSLGFSVPTHVAQRNRLSEGELVTVSLLADGIHLMRASLGSHRSATVD